MKSIKWDMPMLLLLLSHFSRVRFCATPEMAAHQASLSLGFSRQEHWNGLPFPSPVHESEKSKVRSLSRVWLLVTPWTAAYQAPPSMGFSRQEYWSGVPWPFPRYAYSKIIDIGSSILGFPDCASGKESSCQCRRHNRHGFDLWNIHNYILG